MTAGLAIAPPASPEDAAAALALLQAFFREEGFDTPSAVIAGNFTTMLGLDVCRVLLAKEDAVVVGVATVSLDFGIEFGWSAEIGDLYVRKDRRGRGIAGALVAACIDWARGRRATSIRVTVTPHGADAGLFGFYERLGFVDDGRRIPSLAL